jgi:cupin superfamily acireductone dioxygenase involved in methionine salvage
MYNKDMKSVFRYAIELDVLNIRTQNGYKGADILVIETEHEKVAILIKNFCHNIKIDTNVKRK